MDKKDIYFIIPFIYSGKDQLIFSDKRQVNQLLPDGRLERRERLQRDISKLWGGDGYIHYLDCGDGSIVVYIGQNLSNCILCIYAVYYMSIVFLIKWLNEKHILNLLVLSKSSTGARQDQT